MVYDKRKKILNILEDTKTLSWGSKAVKKRACAVVNILYLKKQNLKNKAISTYFNLFNNLQQLSFRCAWWHNK